MMNFPIQMGSRNNLGVLGMGCCVLFVGCLSLRNLRENEGTFLFYIMNIFTRKTVS